MRLHIFNPSHEMALASSRGAYTPPRPVRDLERRLCLLPALYAAPGDAMLIPSDAEPEALPYFRIVRQKGLKLLRAADLKAAEPEAIDPWGWNLPLLGRLRHALGSATPSLPTDEQLRNWRALSHRRTTIEVLRAAGESELPRECTALEQVAECVRTWGPTVVKLPWTSSGRGIFFVCADTLRNCAEPLRRAIKARGSVMAEPAYDKELDFATEWSVEGGALRFRGFSLFRNSPGGNYSGNIVAPQPELRKLILRQTTEAELSSKIEALHTALEQIVAPRYSGPFGVDMLVDTAATVHPCLELNLRRTMGHVAIALWEQTHTPSLFTPDRTPENL